MIEGFCIISEDDIVRVVPIGECSGGGGGSGVVDGQILYDDNHIESLDAGERYVVDVNQVQHINWSDPDFTAYHRPIYIYGPGSGTLTDPEDYSLILRPLEISLHYYVDGSEFVVLGLTSGPALYSSNNDGVNYINPRLIKWEAALQTYPEYTATVKFFPDATNQPYFYLRDDTHAELYIDDIRNYSDDENPNIDLLHRVLHEPDGSVAIDYGTSGSVNIGPTGVVTLGDAENGVAYLSSNTAISGTIAAASMNAGLASVQTLHNKNTNVDSIKIIGLPTSDPHVVNQLWKSGTTLMISAG